MRMEKQANAFEDLLSKTNDYLETRVELLKLKAVGKSSAIASSVVSSIVIGLLLIMVVILLNIGLALWIGQMIGESYLGFFIVTGVYLLVALILFAARKKIIGKPVKNLLIKTFLN